MIATNCIPVASAEAKERQREGGGEPEVGRRKIGYGKFATTD